MKFGDDRTGMRIRGNRARSVWTGTMLILGLLAAPAVVSGADAPVGDQAPMQAADLDVSPVGTIAPAKTRFLSLGVGKSAVIDLPRDVKDVLVADPKIANAVIRSAQRAYIIGGQVGQTNVVFFAADGQQVAAYDIAVKRDLNGMRTALRQSLPGVQIEGVGDSVMLTGSVSSPVEAQQAGDVAAKLVGGSDKVVNNIIVRGRDQVMLKVVVGEVRRDIVKQLGVDLSASLNAGTAVVNFNNSNPFSVSGGPIVSNNGLGVAGLTKGFATVSATMRAMESAGVMRTLAEPSLTAISGESATFIAGRRIPHSLGLCLRSSHPRLHHPDHLQEVRHLPELHSGRAERGSDQPARDDRGVRAVEPERHHGYPGAVLEFDQLDHHPLDPDPPRRNDAGNSLGRLDGDGRFDPAADQTGRQRTAGRGPDTYLWPAVPEPGLHQQRDRTDGSRHALCGSRCCAARAVTSGRRVRALLRFPIGTACPHQPYLRRRRPR